MERVLIVDSISTKKGIINKDVNGGLGTRTQIGNSFRAKFLEYIKKTNVILPLIEYGYVASILKTKGYKIDYHQESSQNLSLLMEKIRKENYSYILFHPALVAYKTDIEIANHIKQKFPNIILGAFGPFVSACPKEISDYFDWVAIGEIDKLLIDNDLDKLEGMCHANGYIDNLDSLPFPDWGPFNVVQFSYKPMITKKPFFTMQGSRGCPMSCGYYCPYPSSQGKKWRTRSISSLIDEIKFLQATHGAKAILFRDAYFSLKKDRVREFAERLIEERITIEWGCETRLDSLDKKLLKICYDAGLRAVNIGIESEDDDILKINRRKGIVKSFQEDLIKYCYTLGIKINGFFILGLDGDTVESIERTIEYSKKLKLYAAQFTVSTPLPGTPFYNDMVKNNKIVNKELELLDNNTMVFDHENLTGDQIHKLKEEAFLRYYFRPSFIVEQIRWKTRELFY
jgi:radical SAM superfamily enzyme YgiQ (UPF0313 family)